MCLICEATAETLSKIFGHMICPGCLAEFIESQPLINLNHTKEHFYLLHHSKTIETTIHNKHKKRETKKC